MFIVHKILYWCNISQFYIFHLCEESTMPTSSLLAHLGHCYCWHKFCETCQLNGRQIITCIHVYVMYLYYKRVGPFFVTVLLDFCEAVDDRPWMTWCVNIWRLSMSPCCGRRKWEENSTKGCFRTYFCINGFPIYFRMVVESPWCHSIEDRQTCEDIHICNTCTLQQSVYSDRPRLMYSLGE
jgi:hypothetical protein